MGGLPGKGLQQQLLSICQTLLQSKREFLWELEIVELLSHAMWHSAISLLYLLQVTPVLAKGFVRGQCAPNTYLSFRVSNYLRYYSVHSQDKMGVGPAAH